MRTGGLLLIILIFSSCNSGTPGIGTFLLPENFDWQGHRGARGLMPENTIEGFKKALEFPIKTLEFDVVISKDSQVVISHEPWMNHKICINEKGQKLSKSNGKDLNIFKLTFEEIQRCDCGSLGNTDFPNQRKIKARKPLLSQVFAELESHAAQLGRAKPFYNIELKSKPEYYEKYTPSPPDFVRLVLNEIEKSGLKSRISLQSFDTNILNEIRKQDAEIQTVYLVANWKNIDTNLQKINFKPDVYSPMYSLLNEKEIKKLHGKDIKVIPWTVNDLESIKELIDWGVDGIISDFPNMAER